MMQSIFQKAAIATVVALGVSAPGVAHANAESGRAVAFASCAYCHVVAPDQGFKPALRPQGPDFATIAADPKTTVADLRRFLFNAHRNVVNVTGSQAGDVASFILSLRKRK